MIRYYIDTSALIKRYHNETGTDAVNLIFDTIRSNEGLGYLSSLALPEAISTLNRKKSSRYIAKSAFDRILSLFYDELEYFTIIPVSEHLIASGIGLIMKHNLNFADSIHLAAAMSERNLVDSSDPYYFVCCDTRLLAAAARKEKLAVMNPESGSGGERGNG
jgi:uncharacterized protein